MHYSLTETPDLQASDCLVIGLFSDGTLPDFAQAIDKQHRGLLSRLAAGLKEKGDINWQADVDGHSLMMIQCGEQNHFTPEALKKRCDDMGEHNASLHGSTRGDSLPARACMRNHTVENVYGNGRQNCGASATRDRTGSALPGAAREGPATLWIRAWVAMWAPSAREAADPAAAPRGGAAHSGASQEGACSDPTFQPKPRHTACLDR